MPEKDHLRWTQPQLQPPVIPQINTSKLKKTDGNGLTEISQQWVGWVILLKLDINFYFPNSNTNSRTSNRPIVQPTTSKVRTVLLSWDKNKGGKENRVKIFSFSIALACLLPSHNNINKMAIENGFSKIRAKRTIIL